MENQTPPLAVGLDEAARISDLSRRTLEGYIAAKVLPAQKIGRRTLISIRALEKFLQRNHSLPHRDGRAGAGASAHKAPGERPLTDSSNQGNPNE